MFVAPHRPGLSTVLLSPAEGEGGEPGAGGATNSSEAGTPAAPQSDPPAGDGGTNDAATTVSKAEYDAAQAELKKLQAFADRMKEAEKLERTKRQEAQAEQGQFRELSDSLRAERDEYRTQLEALQQRVAELEPVAERSKAAEETLRGKVEARLANGLPEHVKVAVSAIPDVHAQLRAIEAYDRAAGTPPPTKPSTPTGGAPPPSGSGQVLTPSDVSARMLQGETLESIKATPEYQAMIAAQASGASPVQKTGGMLANLFSGPAGNRKS